MKNKVLLRIIVFALGILALCGCNRHETYNVTFNANGGTGTMRSQVFEEREAQALRQNTFTRSGYSFSGWNTTQSGSGTAYSNGQTITVSSDMTLYAQWTNGPSQGGNGSGSGSGIGDDPGNGSGTQSTVSGSLNGHDYVDLGLPSGTLWATCNVGATTPEGYGNYYAWGETTTKENYIWSTYRWCNGSSNTITKYCPYTYHGYNGYTDTLTTLEPSDDAATANWGAGWRMPTHDEIIELWWRGTPTWTTQNGIKGYLCSGPNGNSIFLPAAGGRDDYYNCSGSGYWSNTVVDGFDAYCIRTNYFEEGDRAENRYRGYTVRPVCVNR